MSDDYDCEEEGGDDADEEEVIIALSHTVVEPHAVVVEGVDAAVAGAAVFAARTTVAVAEFAVEYFIVFG
mgnify:CR=1 FL=1